MKPDSSTQMDRKKIRLIGFISFLMGFLQSVFIYVMSSYFKQAAGTENVGVFYFVAYSLFLVVLLNLHKLVRIFGKSSILFFALIFKIVALAALILIPPSWTSIPILMLYIIFSSLELVSVDIILESLSQNEFSGRIRGRHLTFINAGFLLGPLLSTRIMERFGFDGIFIFILIFSIFNFTL